MSFEVWIYYCDLCNYFERSGISPWHRARILAECGFAKHSVIATPQSVWKLAEQIADVVDDGILNQIMEDYGIVPLAEDSRLKTIGHIADEILDECSRTLFEF